MRSIAWSGVTLRRRTRALPRFALRNSRAARLASFARIFRSVIYRCERGAGGAVPSWRFATRTITVATRRLCDNNMIITVTWCGNAQGLAGGGRSRGRRRRGPIARGSWPPQSTRGMRYGLVGLLVAPSSNYPSPAICSFTTPATVGHDPQTSNGGQLQLQQQQVQSGGWLGGSAGDTGGGLVCRSGKSINGSSNGKPSLHHPQQRQRQQQQQQQQQQQGQSGGVGDDEDGGGGSGGLEGTDAEANDAVHLKRRVGLVSGVALIVGTMIGSGIFVSPSGLLLRTGSVGISFVVWTACGLLSLCGALAYAELGTMNTSSGAEYAYFMDAFGAPPAFLFSWVSTLVLKPSQMAIICLSFAQYTVEAFTVDCEPPNQVVKIVALLAIVLILLINCYSVNLATGVQNAFTAAKLMAILVVIVGGSYKLIQGNTQHLQTAFDTIDGSTINIGRLATAFYTGLWAYDGWNNLNYVTEEIKNPSKNLPRSIMIGIPLVTLCYALINVSYLAVMSPSEMIESEAVAVTFGNRILGVMAWLMPLSVAISTFGSANGTLFAAGRLCFAASRQGHLLDCLSYVHVRRFTPAPGLIFHSLVAGAMVLSGNIDSLIDFFSFTAWIFYGGAMVALLVMRRTRPNHPRPYKCPLVIPVLVLVISAYLIVAPIIDKPQIEYLYAAGFIGAGMLVYLPFVKFGYVPKFMEGVNAFLQMLLEVAPTAVAFD